LWWISPIPLPTQPLLPLPHRVVCTKIHLRGVITPEIYLSGGDRQIMLAFVK
jgi:hypothetical protein